ncbi:Scr1 family TA system antitoxin-like transcriptional regulator [Streptomyces sp. NPDC005244]|uniref:helix-turn-helix domain-containing protein n=1 Tax=Streptomyces sp. NPDC005244 TaxID=3364708 RepID=UPI0036C55459
MPGPKDLDPASSPRAMIGAELRYARENAGLSQAELGEPLFVSGSFIGQLEAGTRRLHLEYAVQIDEILNTKGFFERNCRALARSKYPDHFAEAAEAIASAIREYAPVLIPGLLQTQAYAQAMFRRGRPTEKEEVIGELVAARLERAHLLDDPTSPLLWTILDEAVLRRTVGTGPVMAGALRHIATLAGAHRVIVQVLPFTAGAHMAMEGSLKLMSFDGAPPLAYLQGLGTGRLEDDPATVAHHDLTFHLLAADALSPSESLALIDSVAEDYAHEEQP